MLPSGYYERLTFIFKEIIGVRQLTALGYSSSYCHISILSVHVVSARSRIIPQPNTKVLNNCWLLLIHLKQNTQTRGYIIIQHLMENLQYCPGKCRLNLRATIVKIVIFKICCVPILLYRKNKHANSDRLVVNKYRLLWNQLGCDVVAADTRSCIRRLIIA